MVLTSERLLEITLATLKAAEFCFLITLGESGQPQTRLMQPFAPEPDLTIWFGTSPTSRKVQDIQRDPRITLAYEHAQDGAYLTLFGTASIEDDLSLRKQFWREAFSTFWPTGPEGDDYVLIKFVPTRIELMHLGLDVAPKPFGLRAATLVRMDEEWAVVEDESASAAE